MVCPVLPKIRKVKVEKPILTEELSSADYCMTGKELQEFLEAEDYLNF